ncbi:hypothetical protein [Acinetobacter junii]|uniref:hypothetical protein n=1 Tax=Acinetobacter junii TaxID=40215 RepID=UPI001F48AED2|nr:hypothetical protein [Acinetobacter junii]
MNGFVAGTLVHTDRGLVPIQNIRIGDMVLSRHKIDDEKLAYKRVTKISKTDDQPIWAMELSGKVKGSDGFKEEFLFTTANHPFWTFENVSRDAIDTSSGKWKSVSDLEMGSPLSRYDGEFAGIFDIRHLYQTTESNKAFYMVFPDYDAGIFLDVNAYENNQLSVPNYLKDESLEVVNWDENEDPIPDEYIATVYNFEVESSKTYFVGELGIWVHQ